MAQTTDTSACTSAIVKALETLWAAIRKQNPDVRPVLFGIGRSNVKNSLGHYRAEAWTVSGTDDTVDLVHIEGMRLGAGARAVAETVLHESVHSAAHAQGISDTSRNGRYHNRQFAQLAARMGLLVEKDERIGHVTTDLNDATAQLYAAEIAELDQVLSAYLAQQFTMHKDTCRMVKLSCACGRVLRASRKTIEDGAIMCGNCGEEFTAE